MVSYSINADENCTSFQVVNTSCCAEVQPATKSVREPRLRIATRGVVNSKSLQLESLLQLERIVVLIAVAACFGIRSRQGPELALA